MPFPPVPVDIEPGNLIQYRLFCSSGNQISINVFHHVVTQITGPGPVTLDEVANLTTDDWAALMIDLLSINARFNGIEVQVLRPEQSIAIVNQDGAAGGERAGVPAPLQACGFIRKMSIAPGRHQNGRFYMPFMSASSVNVIGETDGGYDSALEALAASLFIRQIVTIGPNTVVTDPVIYHRGEIPRYDAMWGTIVSRRIATQRRRGLFGQANNLPF